MGDGSLTFVIPVRDPQGVACWASARTLLEVTVRALASIPGHTRILVAAQTGSSLPPMPASVHVVEVDLPYRELPALEGVPRYQAIRNDKGARVLAALVACRPDGHVMVVDYDDFVSQRLPALVAAEPDCPGWYVNDGYIYDGGRMVLKRTNFNALCGTSLIARADLLRIPARTDDADPAWVARSLGSHIYLRDDLKASGTPLKATPFPAATYRVGHGTATSGSSRLRGFVLHEEGRSQGRMQRLRQAGHNVLNLRLTSSIRDEFGIP